MKTSTVLHFVLYSMLSILIACSSDESLPEPTPPSKAKYLSILPTVASMNQTKAGIIRTFSDDDKIGLFVVDGEQSNGYAGKDANNIPSTFFLNAWTLATDVEVKSEGVVYAYYPYNKDANDRTKVPVETASQTDYLYCAKEGFSSSQSAVTLKMKHALSLVSVRVRKNDYQKTGLLQKIELEGLQTTGVMDTHSGNIEKSGGVSTVSREVNITLDDDNLVKTETIVLPINEIKKSPVKLKATVDGETFIFDVPVEHSWEAGWEYIYTLNLSKQPEEEPVVEFEREYWEKFGKNDNIKIVSNSAYPNLTMDLRTTPHGRTLVKGEAYIFEPCLTNRNKTDFVGKIKLSLWDGDKMVEQFPAYNILADKNFFTTFFIPSYINCEPGTYKLIPLFQKEGETNWFIPPYGGGVEDEDWLFTVQGENKNPAVRSMNFEGYPAWPVAVRIMELNKPFNVEFSLTNKSKASVKGEIKVVMERTFTNEFRVKWLNDGDTFEDEIGSTTLKIDSNTALYKGSINCCIIIQRNTWSVCGPLLHLYYRPEGSNEWVLLRSDADLALQKWKGLVDESNEMPYEPEGLNFLHIALPKDK